MVDSPGASRLDLEDQIFRIENYIADTFKKQQDVRLAPWQLVLGGVTVGAALFAAGAAFIKVIG